MQRDLIYKTVSYTNTMSLSGRESGQYSKQTAQQTA